MSKITAYKSDTDGRIFEHLKDYQAHLKQLAKARREEKQRAAYKAGKIAFMKNMCEEIKSPEELVTFIKDNQEWFITNGLEKRYWTDSERKKEGKNKYTLKEVTITAGYDDKSGISSLRWSNAVPNSHKAPMGKKTNWGGREKNEPRNYPGWNGVLRFSFTEDSRNLSSELFDGTPINSGSGGGGGESYQYSLEIFAHDFKKMAYYEMMNDYEKNKKIDKDRINSVLDISNEYVDWNDERFLNIVNDICVREPDYGSELVKNKLERDLPTTTKKKNKLKV